MSFRRVGGALLGALLAACGAGPRGPANMATPEPEKKLYNLPCDDAYRFAATSLKTNGYRITAVDRSPAGGRVHGVRKSGEEQEFRLTCGADGVRVATGGGGQWSDQAMWFSFNQVAEFGDRIWPPPKGPVVKVQTITGPEAKLYFPGELEPLGLTAVRVRIVNGGSRAFRIEPRRTVARGDAGGGTPALSTEGVKQRLGADPGIDAKLLQPAKLAQGEEMTGFIFFPAGTYKSIALKMIDEPTGEADEFEVFLAE